jgi:penicillin-binding protein 1A
LGFGNFERLILFTASHSTSTRRGAYLEPRMVTRVEDHEGKVLADFPSALPQQALPATAAQTLVDVMRDVVSRGTGESIRTRFGIRADVAGKTGTPQYNTDSWFILMHPQLVAGAWVGFDDARVTIGNDYWGAGAHSALPMVGAFYDMALRAHVIDPEAQFDPENRPPRNNHARRHRHTSCSGGSDTDADMSGALLAMRLRNAPTLRT